MKKILPLLILLVLSLNLKAQQEIKLDYNSSFDFKGTQLILPLALIAVGTTSLYLDEVQLFDNSARELISLGHGKATFDDYLQYAPLASIWILDACGVRSNQGFKEQTTTLAMAGITLALMVNVSKHTIKRKRPDSSGMNSLPSGHTSVAFMGAEFLRKEFKDASPWIGVAGYACAATTAFMRVYNGRHWVTDTVVGAGVGILSARVAYWLAPSVNKLIWGSDVKAREQRISSSLAPFASEYGYGLSASISF